MCLYYGFNHLAKFNHSKVATLTLIIDSETQHLVIKPILENILRIQRTSSKTFVLVNLEGQDYVVHLISNFKFEDSMLKAKGFVRTFDS